MSGKRVLVTRAKEQAKSLSVLIKNEGGIPIEIPLIAFQRPRNKEAFQHIERELETYDWIIFTSANGVRFFLESLQEQQIRSLPKVAVVGRKTEKALKGYGITPSLIPDKFVAESLADALLAEVSDGQRLLFARGNLSRPFLPRVFEERGFAVTELTVYETIIPKEAEHTLLDALQNESIDIFTFTSSSTVKHFHSLLANQSWSEWTKSAVFAYIGPIAANTAKEKGLPIHVVADPYTSEGLIDALSSYLKGGTLK
ncbi:uroporphyrinogen-III synthase [Halalkalibacterium ligniniphilum]|uniref:uroporphyrinogen-III synthase n=1 Tax=Halalkalibacterium ligniniphilum TaxID=1134413 RepID=UPI001F2BC07D|nr:uroporphyrinogen-III synthase [Halalkalibacterium ligniniphilum]